MTVTEHIRQHLFPEPRDEKMHSLEKLKDTEWSEEFETLMRNRLVMGAFRYGLLSSRKKGDYNQIASIQKHALLYIQTGNMEHLVDIANLALVEYIHSRHPNKHWHAHDDENHTEKKGS